MSLNLRSFRSIWSDKLNKLPKSQQSWKVCCLYQPLLAVPVNPWPKLASAGLRNLCQFQVWWINKAAELGQAEPCYLWISKSCSKIIQQPTTTRADSIMTAVSTNSDDMLPPIYFELSLDFGYNYKKKSAYNAMQYLSALCFTSGDSGDQKHS